MQLAFKLAFLITITITIGVCTGAPQRIECDGWRCFNQTKRFDCKSYGYTCCKGQGNHWHVRAADTERECCHGSGELYNPNAQVCVNGTFRKKRIASEYACGLTTTFDADKEVCCKRNAHLGRVYKKGGICCNEIYLTDPEEDCCEGTIYNKSRQTCCLENGVHRLHNISNGACCLDVAYNPIKQKCEDGVGVVNKSSGELSVCNGVFYNNHTHFCCYDQVLSVLNHICYLGKIPVPKRASHHNQACLVRNNDYETFYNGPNRRQVCIYHDRVVELGPNEEVCLDKRTPRSVYDTTVDLCCGGIYYQNGAREGNKCCKDRTNAYNPATELCCYNKISTEISENNGGRCCGKKAYNPRSQACSGSQEIVQAECPSKNKPPFSERCNLTESQIEHLRKSFHKGGLSVYVATVISEPDTEGRHRQWQLEDVEQLASADRKSKRSKRSRRKSSGKIKFENVSGKALVSAKTCSCPYQLITGERYVFFSVKPMKKGKLNLKVMDQLSAKTRDAAISLANAGKLGAWFQILFGNFNS